jgi:hypothetical protein
MNVWNEPYGYACYHPLFVFYQLGDLERAPHSPASADTPAGSASRRFRTKAPSYGDFGSSNA